MAQNPQAIEKGHHRLSESSSGGGSGSTTGVQQLNLITPTAATAASMATTTVIDGGGGAGLGSPFMDPSSMYPAPLNSFMAGVLRNSCYCRGKVALAIFAPEVDEFFTVKELQCLEHFLAQKPEDQNNKNLVKCDQKLRIVLLGEGQVALSELPRLIKLHFPRRQR